MNISFNNYIFTSMHLLSSLASGYSNVEFNFFTCTNADLNIPECAAGSLDLSSDVL